MAKYIITDKGEVRHGENTFHKILAEGTKGRVVAAGHFSRGADGSIKVFGVSHGYNIDSKPEDAAVLKAYFKK